MSGIATSPAQALGSVGLGVECDHDGHCVEATATSTNAAIKLNLTDGESSAGTAVAACKGSAVGATLVQITCSIGSRSSTMSFPGSAGAVPIVTSTSVLARLPVCWDVTAYFPVINGPQHVVTNSGCALLSV